MQIGPLVPEKKIIEGFLPYMSVAAILVMWLASRFMDFHFPVPENFHTKFG